MSEKRCVIVGAGEFENDKFAPMPGDIILAADGGYAHLSSVGVVPRLLIGDMDSLTAVPRHIPRVLYPRMKDDTDLSLALRIAFRHGIRRFELYGVSGSRLDHFYGALQLMCAYAAKGCAVSAVIPGGRVYALHNGSLKLRPPANSTVSVLCPSGSARGVYAEGLLYPLENATLRHTFPLGVSNESILPNVKISVREGTLIVFELFPEKR